MRCPSVLEGHRRRYPVADDLLMAEVLYERGTGRFWRWGPWVVTAIGIVGGAAMLSAFFVAGSDGPRPPAEAAVFVSFVLLPAIGLPWIEGRQTKCILITHTELRVGRDRIAISDLVGPVLRQSELRSSQSPTSGAVRHALG